MCEPTGPINVGWTWGTPQGIEDTMVNNGWTSFWTRENIAKNRWVILRDSSGNVNSINKQDQNIGKEIADAANIPVDIDPTNQWHIRAYDIGTTDSELDVVGQVHHDPWFHGLFHIQIGQFGKKPDRKFAEARQVVTDDWKSWGSNISTINVGNGDRFPTSDGKLGKIYKP